MYRGAKPFRAFRDLQNYRQHNWMLHLLVWFPLVVKSLISSSCSRRRADCIQRFVFCFTTGASQVSARTAGSSPCLSGRSTPEKTLTLICSPRRKTTICTKYSVCVVCDLQRTLCVFHCFQMDLKMFFSWNNLMKSCFIVFSQFTMSSLSALMLTMNSGKNS